MIADIIMWVTAIVTISSLIAASTPTPKDDVWIGKLYKVIDMLALNVFQNTFIASTKEEADKNLNENKGENDE